MMKPIEVNALDGYRIWVKFEDGVEGAFVLSYLVERGNLFRGWEDRRIFEDVKVDREWRANRLGRHRRFGNL